MIRAYFIFIIFFFTAHAIKAQVLIPDSVSTVKVWHDNNGENRLQVHVFAASNMYDNHYIHSVVGYPTAITAQLSNKKYHLSKMYNHEAFELEMLLFYDEAIWFYELNGVQAVFIPIFRYAMLDTEVRFEYIIFYNNKKYLYHFEYECQEGEGDAACTLGLKDKNLQKKLKKMPSELRNIFISYLQTVYTTRNDLTPDHTTFRNPKYKLENQPVVSTDYQANYPYVLLDKIYDLIKQQSYSKATEYIKRFEKERYQDVDEYITKEEEEQEIPESVNLDPETIIQNKNEYLDKAKKLTFDCRYKEAYQIYRIILDIQMK